MKKLKRSVYDFFNRPVACFWRIVPSMRGNGPIHALIVIDVKGVREIEKIISRAFFCFEPSEKATARITLGSIGNNSEIKILDSVLDEYLLLYLFQKSKYSILGLMLFGKRRDKNMKRKNLALTMLLINLFIAFLGIGLVIPVLPTIMNELNLSGSVVGNLVAAFAFVQLLVSPFSGRWA